MRLPFEAGLVKTENCRDHDERRRCIQTTCDGLNKLKPVLPNGTVTFGSRRIQPMVTSMIVTRAKSICDFADPKIEIRLAGFGQARTDKALMPHAPVPASQRALDNAGISLDDVAAVKTHNPFAVNDIVFCRETGYDIVR